MMDRKTFFDAVRHNPFSGLSQGQVDGMNAILDWWEQNRPNGDNRWLAYALATPFHETMRFMQPVIETRRADEKENPSVDTAIARLENSWSAGKLPWVKTPYWRKDKNGLSWLGRGLPQTTHYENYLKSEQITGISYTKNPDLMLHDDKAVEVMMLMMEQGNYTGKKFSDYFSSSKDDPVNARRIINGTDKADMIAGYHRQFLKAIKVAEAAYKPGEPAPEPVPPTAPDLPDMSLYIARADAAAAIRQQADELRAMADALEGKGAAS